MIVKRVAAISYLYFIHFRKCRSLYWLQYKLKLKLETGYISVLLEEANDIYFEID
jgi:hypothetical protein